VPKNGVPFNVNGGDERGRLRYAQSEVVVRSKPPTKHPTAARPIFTGVGQLEERERFRHQSRSTRS